jgi:hypothetical protein
VLLHKCENWNLLKQHERRTEAAALNILISVVGYKWDDHKTNARIRHIKMYNLIQIMCIVHASGHDLH